MSENVPEKVQGETKHDIEKMSEDKENPPRMSSGFMLPAAAILISFQFSDALVDMSIVSINNTVSFPFSIFVSRLS
jgi:hypothetical protein